MPGLKGKFQMAGHILGSAYIVFDIKPSSSLSSLPANLSSSERVVFSGDLGAPYFPLLPAPKA